MVESRWQRFKQWMNSVPDCPSCKGTGDQPIYGYTDYVYWKGRQVEVCGHCKGAGKV